MALKKQGLRDAQNTLTTMNDLAQGILRSIEDLGGDEEHLNRIYQITGRPDRDSFERMAKTLLGNHLDNIWDYTKRSVLISEMEISLEDTYSPDQYHDSIRGSGLPRLHEGISFKKDDWIHEVGREEHLQYQYLLHHVDSMDDLWSHLNEMDRLEPANIFELMNFMRGRGVSFLSGYTIVAPGSNYKLGPTGTVGAHPVVTYGSESGFVLSTDPITQPDLRKFFFLSRMIMN